MVRFILASIFCLCFQLNYAQEYYREYGVSDSTEYQLSADSTIIAGNKTLYLRTSTGVQTVHQFSPSNPNYFLRDFNAIGPNRWYAVIGSRYIANTTTLYRSGDQGQSWEEDTSFYAATRPFENQGIISDYQSISQMHQVSGDTLLLFVSYYQAGIFYSVDKGDTWQFWFANTPAHYQGLFECDSFYYLYGIEGDAFPASMFRFSRDLLLSPDTGGAWQHFGTGFHPACFNSGDPDCIYAPNGARNIQFSFFKNYVDSVCGSIASTDPNLPLSGIEVYPNPAHDWLTVNTVHPVDIRIIDTHGKSLISKRMGMGQNSIWLGDLASGLYFYQITNNGEMTRGKILIK